jgi:GT2 family glycosyltransferase
LEGFRWTEPRDGRPPRLVPTAAPQLLSLAIWPKWGPGAEASLRSLLAQAPPDADVEVLAPASGADLARAIAEAMQPDAGRGVQVRAVDTPPHGTPGAWLAALAEAASGEVVVVCQAGVTLQEDAGALAEIVAWAASPMTGAVTAPIRRGDADPLAGLALEHSAERWRVRSAHAPAEEGRSRPVLAAPAGFLAIRRDKLAMLGGPAAERLPAGGVDLDLGLRLRRLGLPSVLLGAFHATAEGASPPAGELQGAPLAAFDPDELAAAAAAYPAPQD